MTQMYGNEDHFCPESVNRAKRGAEKTKKQDRAAKGPHKHKEPQFAVLCHHGEKKRGGSEERDGCVQQVLRGAAAGGTDSAGQIVEKGQRAAQKDGTKKLGELARDLVTHGAYPNRRRRKLP